MRTRLDLTPRRCVAAAAAATVLMILVLAAPGDAAFNAGTANRGIKVATTAVGVPTNLSVSASGLSTTATATTGANANGYQIGVSGTTNTAPTCPSASYSGYRAPTGGSVSFNFAPAANGSWVCEQARSTFTPAGASAPSWTSQPDTANPTQQVRLGLVPTGVTLARTNCSTGVVSKQVCTPVITITFNQAIADPTGIPATDPVCFYNGHGSGNPDVVIIGDTNKTGCTASDGADVGVISGYSVSSASSTSAATYARSTSDPRTLIVTLTPPSTAYLSGSGGTFRAGTANKVTTAADSTVPICSSTSAPDCTTSVSGTL